MRMSRNKCRNLISSILICIFCSLLNNVFASNENVNKKLELLHENKVDGLMYRRNIRSTPQLSSKATSISSPYLLYVPKATAGGFPITSSDILAQYSLQNGSYFTHMAFDRRKSVLYAGASNRILQLNYNLSVLSQATTGPKPDNPQCRVCPEDTETLETTNHNKILVVNEASSTLITCGSVMQVSMNKFV